MATADLLQGLASEGIPTRIGRFALGQELGRGRMGGVYKATDTQAQQTVAMRVVDMHRFSAELDVVRLRLRNTAKAASGLNCPNIVSVIGGGELQELFYLTLEYVPGLTLRQRLRKGEKFSVSEFLDVARQLCAGLEHAHARKIYHGNLVPWNLIFEDDGTLKIMDFGLAHSLVAGDAREDFAYVPYLSPELLRGEPVDARSDLFSAAAILYEMLAGQKAFRGSSREQVAQNVLDGFAPPAHESSIMIHPGLSAVLGKALAKDPNDRYQRAADLIRELESFQRLGSKPAAQAAQAPAPAPKAKPVSAYGVPTKPVITPKPEGAPEFQSMLEKPTVAQAPAWQPAVTRAKPVAAAPEARPAPQVQPVRAKSDPLKKAAMAVAGGAAILLVVALIALWNTRTHDPRPESVTTKEPAAVASQAAPAETPVAASPATRMNPGKPVKARPVNTAPAAVPAVPTTGELMITAIPAGAMVQIDDGTPEPGPLSKAGIPAGTHTVTFSKAGYVSESRKIEVAAGRKTMVAVSLQPWGAIVMVAGKPAGATILVDGKESGQMPARLTLSEGQHIITVRKDGFLAQSATLTLARGQESQFSPELMEAGRTQEIKTVGKFKKVFGSNGQEMGMVEVKTNPKGATVLVNGQAVSKPTPVTFLLNPGNYEIEVRMDGYRSAKRVISLEKGGQAKVEEQLAKN